MTSEEKKPPVTLLFFDRYNAEDPLFVADVGRRLTAAAKSGFIGLILHASDDAVERVEEAFTNAEADSTERSDLVERAVRLTNQSITRRLIDEGVAAVSIQGCDRALLRLEPDGALVTGNTQWLQRSIRMGGFPVVSLLAHRIDMSAAPVDAARALDALVGALSEEWSVTVVYFTTNRKSMLHDADGSQIATISGDSLSTFEELPVPLRTDGVTRGASAVVVTNSAGLTPGGTVSGTQII